MLAESDVRRNPHFAAPDPRAILEPDTRLHPISRMLARFNEPGSAGLVTSANSPTPYRDVLFGEHFRTSLFVSEPVHNLVHRMVIEPDGSASKGVRAPGEADREFLASSDNWFRPTQLRTGPDGALWIADMYRAVIEHPEWIPPEVQRTIDLRAGSKEGRIYRVVPVDRAPRPIERLDRLDAAGLVAALESPNGWRRDTAQRLLLHSRDQAAVEPLRRLVVASRSDATRVQAVWTLSLLGGLDDATALALLKDPSEYVRTAVVQATRGTLDERPMTKDALLSLDDSAAPRLRFHRALALGDCKDERAAHALADVVRSDPRDPWLRAAVLSSASPHVVPLLVDLLGRGDGPIPDEAVEPLVAMAGAIPDRAALDSVLKVVAAPEGSPGTFAPWKFSALAGLLRASARGGKPIAPSHENGILDAIEAARRVAASAEDESGRRRAIALVGWSASTSRSDRDLLIGLVEPREAIGVQEAAIAALGRTSDPDLPKALLKGWKGFSPAVRASALDLAVSRDAWANALLDLVDAGAFPRAEIDSTHRATLLASRNDATRARAEALFAKADASRKAVLDAYRPALARKGDAAAGRSVFQRACATCHKVGELGVEVGPDLAALKDRSPEALLTAILDPNNAFEAKYASFNAATSDGRVFSGLIANETASSVVLRRAEGKEDTLLRADIDELTSSGKSLMTEGLEKDLTPRDLADLVAFLSTLGARP
jgi:putative heme-binding domain-containing protein